MKPDLDNLLEESRWVRGLARRLVRDEHTAEDISQDVLQAAWEGSYGLEGPRLRAWLATVTRRFAKSRLDRESHRHAVELESARPESSPAESSQRLALHRLIVDAVDSLPELQREVVLLRYFDELPPREIATKLGTSSETVRARLSRGLRLLRERLDEDACPDDPQQGRAFWCAALTQGFHLTPPPLVQTALAGVLTMSFATKALLSTLLLAAAIFLMRGREVSELPQAALQLDTDSSAVLEAEAEMMALRPESTLRQPSGPTDTVAEDPAPIAVEPPGLRLEGRVLEKSGAPARPLRLRGRLLGPKASPIMVWTEPDGSFAFEDLPVDATLRIDIPQTHIFEAEAGAEYPNQSQRSFRVTETPIVLHTIRVPSIEGRVLLESTGEPITDGRVLLDIFDIRGMRRMSMARRLDEEGHYCFGLTTLHWELLSEAQALEASKEWGSLELEVRPGDPNLARKSIRADLSSEGYPVFLSDIELRAARRIYLQINDAEGRGIPGAAVIAANGPAHAADALGRLDMPVVNETPAEYFALALGHELVGFDALGPKSSKEHPLMITLGTGFGVTVLVETEDGSRERELPPGLRLSVEWSEIPFQSVRAGDDWCEVARSLIKQLIGHESLRTSVTAGGNRTTFQTQINESRQVRIPGLRAGARLHLTLKDDLGTVHAEQEVSAPFTPGVTEVRLTVKPGMDPEGPRFVLRGRVLGEDRVPIADASVSFGRDDQLDSVSTNSEGEFETPPLLLERFAAPNKIGISASAAGFMWQAVELVPKNQAHPPLEFILPEARRVTLLVQDKTGQPLEVVARPKVIWDQSHSRAREIATGQYVFRKIPATLLVTLVQVGCEIYDVSLPARDDEVILSLPPHGTLRIKSDPPAEGESRERLPVQIHAAGRSAGAHVVLFPSTDGYKLRHYSFEAVLLPGLYEARVEGREPLSFTIEAGRTLELEIPPD